MNKKTGIILMAAVMATATLSGCGCNKKEKTEEPPAVAATATAEAMAETTAETMAEATAEATAGTAVTATATPEAKKEEVPEGVKIIPNDTATAEIEKLTAEIMGEGTLVIPTDEGKIKEVETEGKIRSCYMFGAAKIDMTGGDSTQIKNFYFDANSGEIFEIKEDDSIAKIK